MKLGNVSDEEYQQYISNDEAVTQFYKNWSFASKIPKSRFCVDVTIDPKLEIEFSKFIMKIRNTDKL